MTDHSPIQAPIRAPAQLHTRTPCEPHVDSEERVQFERRRISRELQPIHQTEDIPHAHSFTSLRSRNVSRWGSTGSHDQLQHHVSAESDMRTQDDASEITESTVRHTQSSSSVPRWHDPVSNFWKTHMNITIDEGSHRDHLALERTFLGYLRTSLVFVMTGILIAQLFRLQRSPKPDPDFGFFVIGRPLSIVFITMGLVVLLFGAFRFWKLQQGLVRGKAHAGGWEVVFIMALSVLLLLGTFALVLGVDIDKTYFKQSQY